MGSCCVKNLLSHVSGVFHIKIQARGGRNRDLCSQLRLDHVLRDCLVFKLTCHKTFLSLFCIFLPWLHPYIYIYIHVICMQICYFLFYHNIYNNAGTTHFHISDYHIIVQHSSFYHIYKFVCKFVSPCVVQYTALPYIFISEQKIFARL